VTEAEQKEYLPKVKSDGPFLIALGVIGGFYILMILALIVADATYTTPRSFWNALQSPEIRYATKLSLFSCTVTTILALIVAVPIGYLMSHYHFRGKNLVDGILDIPIVLPPLVIGLSLLILFQTPMLRYIDRHIYAVTYEIAAVILAQFMVACAFAVRTLRTSFDQINPRQEQVALTLGCSRSQAFWKIVLPEARRGVISAATIAWARALGEFGPILIFAGTTRMKTEVLASTVFLEMSVGNIEAAVAVSLLMVFAAIIVLVIVRSYGGEKSIGRYL
jgi:molybdate transport system permease protein